MKVTTYHNQHPDHFDGYLPAHPVTQVFAFELPGVDDPHRAAETAFEIGNIDLDMVAPGPRRDLVVAYRAAGNRSLSKGDVVQVGELWLAVSSNGWAELPVPPTETITLTLFNRDEVIAFIDGEFHQARPHDDKGFDSVIVDLIGRECAVVILRETVTRTHNEFTIGRDGTVRDRFVRMLPDHSDA